MKKAVSFFLALLLLFSAAPLELTHAKPRGPSYQSPRRSVTTPPPSDNVRRADPARDPAYTNRPGYAPARGGFFGGGFARGLFLGGLAGMLFGGFLPHLGGLGSLLGFLINAFAIVLLLFLVRGIFRLLFSRRGRYDK